MAAFNETADARTVNNFHNNSDVDDGPGAQHHTIGPGVHQAASGAHNHKDGNGVPILQDFVLTGEKSGENSVVISSIISALQTLGAEDKTT